MTRYLLLLIALTVTLVSCGEETLRPSHSLQLYGTKTDFLPTDTVDEVILLNQRTIQRWKLGEEPIPFSEPLPLLIYRLGGFTNEIVTTQDYRGPGIVDQKTGTYTLLDFGHTTFWPPTAPVDMVAVGAAEGSLFLWDGTKPGETQPIDTPNDHPDNRIYPLAYDGQMTVMFQSDSGHDGPGTLTLLEIDEAANTATTVAQLRPDRFVQAAIFISEQNIAFTTENKLTIWNPQTSETRTVDSPDAWQALHTLPDSTIVATGTFPAQLYQLERTDEPRRIPQTRLFDPDTLEQLRQIDDTWIQSIKPIDANRTGVHTQHKFTTNIDPREFVEIWPNEQLAEGLSSQPFPDIP